MSSRKLGEIIFIGNPSEFASLLKYLNWEIDRETGVFNFPKQRIEGRYVETPIDPESTGFAVGFDRLVSDKEPPFWVKGGAINAHTLPNGKTKLTVYAGRVKPKDHESELLITWEWLCAYLRENGRAENDTEIVPTNEKAQQEIPAIITKRQIMRGYYKDYTVITAKHIASKLPDAWVLFEQEGGIWGPGIISRKVNCNPTTTGRYLEAFRKAGITEINGVELPTKHH